MSQSEARWEGPEPLMTYCPADLEKPSVAAHEEEARINVVASHLDGEED